MLLGAHETVIRSAYAVLEAHPGSQSRRAGVLYLTTDRLVFEAPSSRGLVHDLVNGRDVEIVVDEPLAQLRNAGVRKGRLGKPRLVVEHARHRLAFDVLEPESWTIAVAEARRAFELAREAGRTPEGRAGRPIVKVRCRYCGSLADEHSPRCAACGGPL